MTHTPFPIAWRNLFIETAFEKRFQALLRSAWQKRTWHVIVADPGSGKTTGIIDLVRTTGSPSGTLSGRRYPILAVTCPKDDENEQTLGNYLYRALGLPLQGHWSERKCKLMGLLVQYGVQCLVFDDAHDISIPHLTFIKELTDQGKLPPYDHPLGVCLVTAGHGDVMPLKETLDQPETLWVQFRQRMDKLQPFCRIAGHTSTEVQEILATLETECREVFPQLNLRQWSGAIYRWLTHPLLDPTGGGRVVMGHLMKLVTTALEWSYEAGETDVRAETLEKAAELLTLGRDIIRLIDGAGPTVEILRSATSEQESVPQAEAGEASAKDAPKQRPPLCDEVGETPGLMRSQQEKGRVTKRLFFDRMRFNKKIDLSRKKRQMKYTEAIQKCLKERGIEKEDPRLRDWQQALAHVKDPRRKQGQRFTLTSMLLVALAAILSNHVSELAIAQWGAGQSEEVKKALGFEKGVTPHQTTIQRLFRKLSREELEEAFRRIFLQMFEPNREERGAYAVAMDGKVQKGRLKFEEEDSYPIHAVSIVEHETGIVLTQGHVERGDTETKSKQPDKKTERKEGPNGKKGEQKGENRENEQEEKKQRSELAVAYRLIAQIDWKGKVLTGDLFLCSFWLLSAQ